MYIINETERNNLLTSMKKLLTDYDYEYTDAALNKIIDTWDANKAPLINAFKKHPNYVDGKFMIVFDRSYERTLGEKEIGAFADFITLRAAPRCRESLPEEIDKQRREENCQWLPRDLFDVLRNLKQYCTGRTINEDFATTLDKLVPAIHVHNGEKTSRVINRLCKYLGYDKHEDYNKEFAKFADALSPITITQRVVLSLNPIDYLTMSFGNSWASCHTIDKANKRKMPNDYHGCYSSGTMSYMLDETSMVLYVVDKTYNGTEYELQPKINRQMFHYGEDKLVQGRLYPQSNDGDGSAYEPYRQIVQEVMSTIFEFPNLWTLKKGTSAICDCVYSEGTHYRDYSNFRSCSISKAKYKENATRFTIGHDPICIECGEEHDVADNINCCHNEHTHICTRCGCVVRNEGDVRWIGGDPYCEDCVTRCDCCNDWFVIDEGHDVDGYGRVCDDCYENNFITCEICGRVVYRGRSYHIEDEDKYVCKHCAQEKYERCADCGRYYPKGSLNDKHICKRCEGKPKIEYKTVDFDSIWSTISTSATYKITYDDNGITWRW